jgi:hypothetical protein
MYGRPKGPGKSKAEYYEQMVAKLTKGKRGMLCGTWRGNVSEWCMMGPSWG